MFAPGAFRASLGFPILLCLLGGCEPAAKAPPAKVAVGQVLADIAVKDLRLHDTVVSLQSGKVTVLNLWATWCPPCRAELPSLERLSQQLDPARFRVIGLSVDTDDHVVREFLAERKVTYPNFIDPANQVGHGQWGVYLLPATLVIGPDGVVRRIEVGERVWDDPAWVAQLQSIVAGGSTGPTEAPGSRSAP